MSGIAFLWKLLTFSSSIIFCYLHNYYVITTCNLIFRVKLVSQCIKQFSFCSQMSLHNHYSDQICWHSLILPISVISGKLLNSESQCPHLQTGKSFQGLLWGFNELKASITVSGTGEELNDNFLPYYFFLPPFPQRMLLFCSSFTLSPRIGLWTCTLRKYFISFIFPLGTLFQKNYNLLCLKFDF